MKYHVVFAAVFLTVFSSVLIDDFLKRRQLRRLLLVQKKLELASQCDFLTGLPNRQKLHTDLQELVECQLPFHLVMLDINDFKSVNDTYGHLCGDHVLCEISERMLSLCNEYVNAYRFAGDEFVLIFRVSAKEIADFLLNRFARIFDTPFLINGINQTIHGSFGLSSYPCDADTVTELISLADQKMYQAKKTNK